MVVLLKVLYSARELLPSVAAATGVATVVVAESANSVGDRVCNDLYRGGEDCVVTKPIEVTDGRFTGNAMLLLLCFCAAQVASVVMSCVNCCSDWIQPRLRHLPLDQFGETAVWCAPPTTFLIQSCICLSTGLGEPSHLH
jgi:hypothetical protein